MTEAGRLQAETTTSILLLTGLLALSNIAAAAINIPGAPRKKNKTASESKHLGGLLRFGEDVDIRPGDTVDGPILVFNGSVAVAGTVDGPVVVMGGSADVSGNVDGPVVALGGSTDIKSGAQVSGPAVAIGGHSAAEDGAHVDGTVLELPWSHHDAGRTLGVLIATLAGLLGSLYLSYRILTAFGWIALAVVAWLLFSRNLENSRNSLENRPGLTALVGILFWPSLGIICLTLLVSILGIPFLPFVAVGAVCAWFWGFTTLAYFLGHRLGGERWQNQIYSVLTGAVLLQLLRWLPVARWAVCLVVAVFGVGTAVLSVFGSRSGFASRTRG